LDIFDPFLSSSLEKTTNDVTTLLNQGPFSPNSPRRLLKFKGALINPPKSRRP